LLLYPHLWEPDRREGTPVFERNLGLAGGAFHAPERNQKSVDKAKESAYLAILHQDILKDSVGGHHLIAGHSSLEAGLIRMPA
jgi:hypothetical protein